MAPPHAHTTHTADIVCLHAVSHTACTGKRLVLRQHPLVHIFLCDIVSASPLPSAPQPFICVKARPRAGGTTTANPGYPIKKGSASPHNSPRTTPGHPGRLAPHHKTCALTTLRNGHPPTTTTMNPLQAPPRTRNHSSTCALAAEPPAAAGPGAPARQHQTPQCSWCTWQTHAAPRRSCCAPPGTPA